MNPVNNSFLVLLTEQDDTTMFYIQTKNGTRFIQKTYGNA